VGGTVNPKFGALELHAISPSWWCIFARSFLVASSSAYRRLADDYLLSVPGALGAGEPDSMFAIRRTEKHLGG
jgi:hypothetical protein